jgi:predicted DNA-binding transcriptional regulator AlpA
MGEYAVHLTTDRIDVTDDQLDDIVTELIAYAGVPSMVGGRLSLQLTVEASSISDAVWHVEALAAAPGITGSTAHVVAVEVQTAEEFARSFDEPRRTDDLAPTSEVAEILGVKRQRVLQLAKRPDFPRAVRLGVRGLHFSRAAVGQFKQTWDRSPGPKRKKKRPGTADPERSTDRLVG